ncbi:MAG: hypothetical protein WBC82_08460, partial [Dehalococcoidia bacterium]
MRRQGIQIVIAVVLVVTAASLAFAGCSGVGPSGNETTKIKVAIPLPEIPGYFGGPMSEGGSRYYEKAIETVTEGRIDIEMYYSEILCKQELAYDAVSEGIADIAWAVPTYCPEWIPLETVFFLGLDMNSCEQTYWVHNHVFEEHLQPYYEQRGLILPTLLGREKLIVFSAFKRIDSMEDFVGVTTMSGGKEMEQLISRLGALSVAVQFQDTYEALQKGSLDAAMLDITVPLLLRWYEAGDPGYIIDCGGIGMAMSTYIANEDLLTKLRPEDAYALLKLGDYWTGVAGSQGSDRSNLLYWDEVPKVGMELITWPESEKEKLRELKREVYQWWIDWMESDFGLGEEAEALLEAVLEEMENYEPGNKAPANPASFGDKEYEGQAEEWRQKLRDAGWTVDEESWQEVVGPDGHWGMDFVYEDD